MQNSFLVMAGAALGGLLRYHLGRLAVHLAGPAFPWGTLAANLLGGFAMGALTGLLARMAVGSEHLRLLLGVGLLGGFTTFSAFSLDIFLMLEKGAFGLAMLYMLASVLGALGALCLGLFTVRAFA